MKPQQNPLSKLSPSIEEVVTDQLRELLPRLPTRTQKTREVANLLFFGHGIYPSAQLVRHFTQQGSMGDIGADLTAFWQDVREKARVRVDGAGLPDDVVGLAGDLVQRLWSLALAKAAADLSADKADLEERAEAANRRSMELLARVQQIEAELKDAQAQAARLAGELGSERDARAAAEQAVSKANLQAEQEREKRSVAEQRFVEELRDERESRARSEDRLAGETRFAKIQIEEARSSTRELQERYKLLLADKDLQDSQFSIRLNGVREELGSVKLKLAETEGRLHAALKANEQLSAQVTVALKDGGRAERTEATAMEDLRSKLLEHAAAFEIADLADASTELVTIGERQGVRLSIGKQPNLRALTPVFSDLSELDKFCSLHAELYREALDQPGGHDAERRWFWED